MHGGLAKEGLYHIQEISSSPQVSSEGSLIQCCQDLYNKLVSIFATFSNFNMFNSVVFTGINKSCNQVVLSVSIFLFYFNLLHQRFDHPTPHTLKIFVKTCNVFASIYKIMDLSLCNACQYGKYHLKHFDSVITKTTTPLQLFYANLWGLSHIISTQGYNYNLSILDDYNRFT